jgi:hypothetical protein
MRTSISLAEESESVGSSIDNILQPAEMQGAMHGIDHRQPGESLMDQEAGQDDAQGTSHLLTNYNAGEINEDELIELIGQDQVTKRHIYPQHGTDGFLGNMHTSKVVLVVGMDGDRLSIRLKEEAKCVQGLQGYNSSSRNDLKKQSRPSLACAVKKLGSLVSFYFTPYKTQAETEMIPDVLQNIRKTLRLLKEVWSELSFMAYRKHRRPVRLELFYIESAASFFQDDLLYPTTPVSIAEGIVQVVQHEVALFHNHVNRHVFVPLDDAFKTSDTESAPNPADLDAGEKTYLAFAAETAAVFYGCIAAEGPIFRTLRLRGWKSALSFQPNRTLRFPARLETYGWCRIPYRLKPGVRPCAFETGSLLFQIGSPELRNKEMRKLELEIAVQMKNIVRIPLQYAKAKARILSLLHERGKIDSSDHDTDSSVDETDSYVNTPGLFDDIHFEVLAQLDDDHRRRFLEDAVNSILVLYSAEWRDILDGKIAFSMRQSPTSSNGRGSTRRGPLSTRRQNALPRDIEIPVTFPEVCSMMAEFPPSANAVSASIGSAITDVNGEFVIVINVWSRLPFLSLNFHALILFYRIFLSPIVYRPGRRNVP